MTNFLEKSSSFLKGIRDNQLSVSAVYSRPKTGQSVTVPDCLGKTPFRIHDGFSRSKIVYSRDHLISAALLVFGTAEVIPQEGDRITVQAEIFEVLSINDEPCWRWSGPFKLTRRIHTKKVGNV